MTALIESLVERTASVTAPIAGDKPGGVDSTFDPEFEKVKGEFAKLESMGGGQPNWRDINTSCTQLLSTKVKDIRLGTWLVVAKMNLGGWPGLVEGLVVYRSLVRDFWDTMFPEVKRARARAQNFSWMGDQVAAFLEPKDVAASDGDGVRSADAIISEIDGILSEKLGESYPGPGKLRGLMREKMRAVPAEAPPAPPPAPDAPAPPASAAAAPPPPAPVAQAAPPPAPVAQAAPAVDIPAATNADDAVASVRSAGKVISESAKLIRRADPAQAWPYQLQRIGSWVAVRQPPPAEGGKTRIPPPAADVVKKMQTLLAGEKWMELLNTAEDATGTYLFWLDLHRYVALAMDRLGALFLGAREVVGREVVTFVTRFPQVPTLAFNDGKAFADEGTKTWLEEEAKKYAGGGGGGGGGGGSAAANAEDEEVAKRFEEAKELVSSGKVADGLGLGLALANRAADARMRFRSHLSVAKLALDGGKPEVAKPMLEALLAQVEQHGLEAWEPSVCATLYAYLLTSLRSKGGNAQKAPEALQKEAFLFDKLCRLDPAAALKIAGG